MIPDLDIWRTANLMIKRYGKDAVLQASMRADGVLEDGDQAGPDTRPLSNMVLRLLAPVTPLRRCPLRHRPLRRQVRNHHEKDDSYP
jgi:hypothetical protein